MTTPTERIAVINRAIDWLEANPSRHQIGDLCKEGARLADPRTKSEDACFCVLGRILHEANPSNEEINLASHPLDRGRVFRLSNFYDWLGEYLAPLSETRSDIVSLFYVTNDNTLGEERYAPPTAIDAPDVPMTIDVMFDQKGRMIEPNTKTIAKLREFTARLAEQHKEEAA